MLEWSDQKEYGKGIVLSMADKKNDNTLLSAQNVHWEKTYAANHEMFGEDPSEAAKYAAVLFHAKEKRDILELGAGQGRDTLFFAYNGFQVHALDYSYTGLATIQDKALAAGLRQRIAIQHHDARQPLPFQNASLDSCYAHMLFCMALTTPELSFLSKEIRRVLTPGGFCVYTVRNTTDPQYQRGIHRGEEMYEFNGFIVHFFSREKIHSLAGGYEIFDITEFAEGELPRKLFRITLIKK